MYHNSSEMYSKLLWCIVNVSQCVANLLRYSGIKYFKINPTSSTMYHKFCAMNRKNYFIYGKLTLQHVPNLRCTANHSRCIANVLRYVMNLLVYIANVFRCVENVIRSFANLQRCIGNFLRCVTNLLACMANPFD